MRQIRMCHIELNFDFLMDICFKGERSAVGSGRTGITETCRC